jgi:hypothetical protein
MTVIGCSANKNEGEVSGTVTYQGQPLPVGTVSFFDSSNKYLVSTAITKGTYATPTPLKVPIGSVKISVTTPNSSRVRRFKNVGDSKAGATIPVIAIPAKYGSAEQSGLNYTIKPGANTYNIELQ